MSPVDFGFCMGKSSPTQKQSHVKTKSHISSHLIILPLSVYHTLIYCQPLDLSVCFCMSLVHTCTTWTVDPIFFLLAGD